MRPANSYPWLFSPAVDLAVFLGSALASLVALAVGARLGILHRDTPGWAWVAAILLIDVAHVWSTSFRVYFDPQEFLRRPWLYLLVPLAGFLIGVALFSEGELVFWRILAYVAVFHFIRQQYGWVALYRAKAGETDTIARWIDNLAIYLATIYPLLYWHCHLPRGFSWFLKDDFVSYVPQGLDKIVAPFYWLALGAYFAKAGWLWTKGRGNPGKDIVVATTALCWYIGIIYYNSDYAFTVTNVIIHGVPYIALVYWHRFEHNAPANHRGWTRMRTLIVFLATLWLIAYVEELVWDRGVWHKHDWLFGQPWNVDSWKIVLVPLLAVPQLTHYILDGFIWKRRSNPSFTLVSRVA